MMQRVFHTNGYSLLALYSKMPGVVYEEMPGTQHVAHVTWVRPKAKTTDERSNIDYFLVGDDFAGTESVVVRDDIVPPLGIELVCSTHYELVKGMEALEETIRRVASRDIFVHNQGKKVPAVKEPPKVEYVDEIVSKAVDAIGNHASIQPWGKQDFHPKCILDINLDFAPYCINGISPNGKLAPHLSCDYCYAIRHHQGYPRRYAIEINELVKRIEEARRIRAEGRETESERKVSMPTRYLRLGKRTEAGADLFREEILTSLWAAIETGLKVVFPTKHLKFDREIAGMLKQTDSTLLYSIGADEFERGAAAHGRTNEWRFEQARLYLEAGVRAVPYVLIDATREDGGYFAENFRIARTFPQVQVLPLRIGTRELGQRILGSWDKAVGQVEQMSFFDQQTGGFEQEGDGTLVHNTVCPSLAELVDDNTGDVGMCSHNKTTEWCNGCFMPGEEGVIAARERVELPLAPQRSWSVLRKKRTDPNQSAFDFSDG